MQLHMQLAFSSLKPMRLYLGEDRIFFLSIFLSMTSAADMETHVPRRHYSSQGSRKGETETKTKTRGQGPVRSERARDAIIETREANGDAHHFMASPRQDHSYTAARHSRTHLHCCRRHIVRAASHFRAFHFHIPNGRIRIKEIIVPLCGTYSSSSSTAWTAAAHELLHRQCGLTLLLLLLLYSRVHRQHSCWQKTDSKAKPAQAYYCCRYIIKNFQSKRDPCAVSPTRCSSTSASTEQAGERAVCRVTRGVLH